MNEENLKTIVMLCAIWGAALSTLIGTVTLWEKFWKNRVRLATTYSWSTQDGSTDQITILNLSGTHVHVAHWTLAWKPNLFHWKTMLIDVTPEDNMQTFTIGPNDSHILYFEEPSKFDWSYRNARHRQLYLTLYLFNGRPKVLRIGAGE